jgi:hypothetical protein
MSERVSGGDRSDVASHGACVDAAAPEIYTPCVTYARGPEYEDSGDPQWIEPEIREGGALEPDAYIGWGRWRARIFPPDVNVADSNPLVLGRHGLMVAVDRLFQALSTMPATLPVESTLPPSESPTAKAIVAVFDALEWVHSLHDHLESNVYTTPSAMDPEIGPYVEGLLAARNASHHGLRRVVGFTPVAMSVYKVDGGRWVHSGEYMDRPTVQLRWVRDLPPRSEAKESDRAVLRSSTQIANYSQHLAGRDVRNTFLAARAFFFNSISGLLVPPDALYGPAEHPPPIDPAVVVRSDKK